MAAKLPRLQIATPIVDKDGKPTAAFQRFWQSAMEQIEARLGAVELAELNTAIAGANAAAANANAVAENITSINNLQTSFVSDDCVISGDPATGIATVSAHSRLYGDGVVVAVSGGSVTGLALGTIYYIYYDDAARAGGAVVYHADTNAANTGYTSSTPDRHFVGYVVMPLLITDPPAAGVPNARPIEVPQPAPPDFTTS